MDVFESLEQLMEVLNVFIKILIELVLPSAVFIISLLTYVVVRYIHDTMTTITGLSPDNPFYQQANVFMNGLEIMLGLLGLAGSVFALRHLKELSF